MRINEIVKESDLQEGPILNKIGSAIGKGVGTLAKGVGAVAGGIAGLGAAAKKGFQAGKATVSGAGDTDTTPAAGTAAKPAAPAADTGASNTSAPAATQPSAAGSAEPKQTPAAEPAPAAAPAAEPAPATKPAADKGATDTQAPAAEPAPATTPAADATQATPAPSQTQTTTGQSAANDTQYKQAQKAIAALQPADQKQILTALEADPKVKSAIEKAAQPKQQPKQDPGSQAFGQMANQLSKGTDPAATPTTTPAAGATDTAVPTAEVPAKKTKTASRVPKKAAPSQAEIDADRENNPNIQMSNNSIIRTGRNLSEAPLITAAPAAQPPAAKSSAALDNLKAFKKGWDSGADTSAVGQGPKLQDPSGRVPPDMLERLNKLQSAQRTELYNLLVKMNP